MNSHNAIVIGGGQSGLAAAHALITRSLHPLVLEAGDDPVGSWPYYYDSLTLFSPARYSALPGLPFPGDPEHYPHRDEVVDYLRSYAKHLDADIRTGYRVTEVLHDNDYRVATPEGTFTAPVVFAATGGFGNPHRPLSQASKTSPAPSCTPRNTAPPSRSTVSASSWSAPATQRSRSPPNSPKTPMSHSPPANR
ncbi:hypothetical protein GCM10017774_41630 [Lentzea cavernae]|uniref:Pyridine nucleotide-disulphide oxidoreductase n=1 Tax=Lentzea cavernae TaxID=2020703 RepID=A0ABQ3MFA1_9PSEU|nr:hypothetical protein GCM10017774_41630 [Lentzea cavernae]